MAVASLFNVLNSSTYARVFIGSFNDRFGALAPDWSNLIHCIPDVFFEIRGPASPIFRRESVIRFSEIMTETQQKAKCITLKGSAELVTQYLRTYNLIAQSDCKGYL